jgi:DNA ligase-1
MPDLADGESIEMKGSAARPYVLKNTGGVYSCTCPAWRNQSAPIEQRSCKHLRKLRGAEAEEARVGAPTPRAPRSSSSGGSGSATAPPLLLAHSWDASADLTGWWMSEKLDGVRAYWDGAQFVSRLGNRYVAPEWFTAGLPDTPLDGELWVGRGRFQETVSIVRRADGSELWRQVRFLVFDAPARDDVFEGRMQYLDGWVAENLAPHAEVVPHERCAGTAHLEAELARVEGLGGEGLMMRQPGSRYEVGRSSTLLKIKTFSDAEARVIGHLPGAGRHKGRLGALRVVTPEGVEFSVGTGLSDAQRGDPPPIGAVITYRFQELTRAGVPRFPSFVGVRDDYAWPGSAATATSASGGTPAATAKSGAASAGAKAGAASAGAKATQVGAILRAGRWQVEQVLGDHGRRRPAHRQIWANRHAWRQEAQDVHVDGQRHRRRGQADRRQGPQGLRGDAGALK